MPPGYTQQLSSFHAAATAPISPSQALPSNFSTPSGWQLLSNNGYGGIGLGNGAVIGYNPNFANGRVPGISFTIPLPPFPVILDLDGDGLRIDPLSSSTQFVDQNGDGYHSRIAWAGKGDGVLVLDADHDGKLSNAKEFAFTEWDSTAKGDLEALKNIFDTNHNGKLDAGDAKWADFKVLVDGQMKSLSELGIASIDLTPSGSGQSFSDGSAITGTTTFTRTNGTTGAAGDAVLATESGSYIVKQTKTTNADGSVTTDILGYNADGSKAFENVVTVNAAGTSRTIKYDDNGDGVFDRSQTVTDSKWQTYSNVEMVSNYNADGSLRDSARTERSTDLHWVKTELDRNGDGIVDQRQLQNLEADGSTTTTTSNLAVNGTTINQTQVIASANGLSKTTKVDHAGSGTFDQITTDVTVVDAGGNRTQTVTDTGSNGTVLDKTVTITSTDRATSTIQTDEDGNGSFDTVEQISRSVAPDGTHVTWVVDYNADGSKRTIHTTNISADGLGKTEYFDRNSDGPADEIRFDGTVIASDGSRTQTVWDKSGNGTLLSQTVTVTSADKKTITITADANGDGATDQTTSIVVGADGSTTKMISNFGPNGTLISRGLSTTSANGLTRTTGSDLNGDGSYDAVTTDVIVRNTDGSSTETVTDTSANGALIGKSVITTSANGLTSTKQQDLDGNGTIDRTTTDAIVLNGDGSRTESVSVTSNSGALLSKTVTTDSANRLTSTISTDQNGDGHVDSTLVNTTNSDGSTTKTVSDFTANGGLVDKTVTTVSANGLSTTTQRDITGDGAYDAKSTDVIVLNPDGSKTDTKASYSANGTLLSKQIVTTSGNGLSIITQTDANGDGAIDAKTTDVTVINANGSRTQTISNYNGAGTVLLNQTVTTTAGNGLTKSVASDVNGDGVVDRTLTDVTSLNADGSTAETVSSKTGKGMLIAQTTTKTSADGRTVSQWATAPGFSLPTSTDTTIGADGSKTQIISAHSADGTKTVSTTSTSISANGLSKTVKTDVNGDGVFDAATTDVTVKNADGSSTQTVTNTSANGALTSKSVTTTSANGLTSTRQDDLDGNGTIDRTTTDATVLNADGSRAQTVSVTSNTGALLAKTTTSTSADRLLTTVTADGNGDGYADMITTNISNADGSTTKTQKSYAANGSLLGTVQTVALNPKGTFVWTFTDTDGNGSFDRQHIESDVFNADGSVTHRSASGIYGGDWLEATLTTTSGDGLSTTTRQIRGNRAGDGTGGDLRGTDVITLNADGSKTRTVTSYAGFGTGAAVTGKTITTTAANGLSTTSSRDIDGNGTIDQTTTDVTILNADGSTVETIATKASNGSLIAQTTTTTNADGKAITTTSDLDGDGSVDTSVISTLKGDGSTTKTTSSFVTSGILASRATQIVSADGLSKSAAIDVDGNGSIDQSSSLVTITNADGSRKQTQVYAGQFTGSLTTTTSANGLSVMTQMDGNGDGIFERVSSTTKTLNADGSVTTVASNTNADGSLHDRTTTTVSADQNLTITVNDVDGDGTADQTIARTVNVDGSVSTVYSDGVGANSTNGAGTNSGLWNDRGWIHSGSDNKRVTVSGNGLSTTTDYDVDGDGFIDSQSRDVTVINADGSTIRTLSNYTARPTNPTISGPNSAYFGAASYATYLQALAQYPTQQVPQYSFTLKDKAAIITSADGLTITRQWDLTGAGNYSKSQADQTTLNADGSKTQTISSFAGTALTSRYATTTSANGLTVSRQWDPTGTGSYSQSQRDTTTLNADGTTSREVTSFKGSLVMARMVTNVAADGLTSTNWIDTDGIGGADHVLKNTVTTLADGSTIATSQMSGPENYKIITTTGADGHLVTVLRDANGDGIVDQKEVRVKAVDGGSTVTMTDLKADGSLKDQMVTTTHWDGRATNTTWDLNGDGIIDRVGSETSVLNADGSSSSMVRDSQVSQRGAGGAFASISPILKQATTTKVSADGKTTTITVDVDGNDSIDQTVTAVTAVDSSVVATTVNNDAARKLGIAPGNAAWNSTIATVNKTVAAKTVTTTSADGVSWTVQADYDGNGSLEHTENWQKQIDGSQFGTIQEVDAFGAIVAKGTETISADGLTTTLKQDTNNDGVADHVEVSVKRIDGSVKKTVTDLAADGSAKSGSTITVDAPGTYTHIANNDGSYTDIYGNGGIGLGDNPPHPGLESSQRGYDAQRRMTFARDVYADGYTWEQTLDAANTQSWNGIENSFDPNGRLTQQRVRNDDGGYVDIYPMGTHVLGWGNPANVWSQQNFDAQGRQTWGRDNFADGSHWEGSWDQSNTQPWWTYEVLFDGQGRQTFVSQSNDDGTRVEKRWDYSSNPPWATMESYFDAQGRKMMDHCVNTDGSGANFYYIVPGTPGVIKITQNFRSDGVFTWMYGQYQGGMNVEQWIDPRGWLQYKNYMYPKLSGSYLLTLSPDNHQIWNSYFAVNQFIKMSYGTWGPVELDLDGNGLTINPLFASSSFANLEGDGTRQHTAWAGKGDGVLVYDADGDDKISNNAEFAFTAWDPSASSDMQALRAVFDTNHDGKLDAADTGWSKFKVLVNGQMKTLGELGIASIELNPAGGPTTMADGSAITGTANFTRADGSTGLAGNVQLAGDPNQVIVDDQSVANTDGSVTRTVHGVRADGSGSFIDVETVSADGLSRSITYDDNADGMVDRKAADITLIHADGSRTRTIADRKANGTLIQQTVIERSADGKTVTTRIDSDGSGTDDRVETSVVNIDGSTTTTTIEAATSLRPAHTTILTVNTDGLSRTQVTRDSAGALQETVTDLTTRAVDGATTQTVSITDANGTLLSRTQTVTSADGHSRTSRFDDDGDGDDDRVQSTTIAIGQDGAVTTTVSNFNGTGALAYRSITAIGADARSKTISIDVDGDGSLDSIETDTFTANADGTSVKIAARSDGTGNLLQHTSTALDATGKQVSIGIDIAGNGQSVTASGASVRLGDDIAASVTGNGNQILIGHDSALTALGANDTFVFAPNFGHASISGYEGIGAGADRIVVDHTVFHDWASLLEGSRQVGDDVVITANANDTIMLKNTAVADLHQSNFQFA
ncbi:hypothetical protein ACTJKX_36640 [Labrys sp. 22185]